MPLAKVRPWDFSEQNLDRLRRHLPGLIARHLSIEKIAGDNPTGAQLSPADIEIQFDPPIRPDLEVHGDNDFSVSIEAMHFPERAEIVQRAANAIAAAIEELTDHKGFVWITLPTAGYAEINAKA